MAGNAEGVAARCGAGALARVAPANGQHVRPPYGTLDLLVFTTLEPQPLANLRLGTARPDLANSLFSQKVTAEPNRFAGTQQRIAASSCFD